MDEGILVPISLFAMVVLIIWLFQHFGARKRQEAFKTLRLAIEKGQEITPAAMEAMARMSHPLADLRRGIVFVAIAAAFAAFGAIIGWGVQDEDIGGIVRGLCAVAVFPLFVGLAFLGLHFFASDRKRG